MQSITTAFRQPMLRRLLITGLLLLTVPAGSAYAADYFVLGRVYTATALAAGEAPPANPLTGVPADQILGDGLMAQVPRNLVKVRVIRASDGAELGSYITRKDGGYLVSFSTAAASISARLVIEEIATSKVLFDSEAVTLSAWPTPNIKFVLVPEELAEITGDREFATGVSAPQYTGIFTRVGKIEIQTENPPGSGVQQRLIDFGTGEASVPNLVAGDLQIPEYRNSAFGGNLYLFGAFSQDLYNAPLTTLNPNLCYKIEVRDLVTAATSDFSDPLVKTKYTVNFSTGTVDTERITLGPHTIGGVANCYRLTPIAASNNEFWSFPDLVALWRTGTRDSRYRLTLSVENLSLPVGATFTPIAMFTDITVRVDNSPLVAQIQPLVAGDFDTPRVYTPVPGGAVPPGAMPASADLTPALLEAASFATYYGGAADPTCEIFSVQAPGDKFVAFKLSAHQPNGYLRSWNFHFERNDKKNQTLLGKVYDGTPVMANLGGASVNSSQTSTSGFQDMFLYVDRAHLEVAGEPIPIPSCAYRFVVAASRRVTDGYQYLSSRWDQDLHYVQK